MLTVKGFASMSYLLGQQGGNECAELLACEITYGA